jgi:protein TonB
MPKERKSKSFIHTPQYPGGKKAFGEFIRQNLRYPEEALKNRIEGRVYVSYQVNDYGEVITAEVTHGIGYGCDEEAIRIVKLMKYDKAKNRGLRVISTVKTFIEFRLAPTPVPQAIAYTVVKTPEKKKDETPGKKPAGETYGYTIKF